MELFFTPTHVLIATVAAFLVGGLWYSPVLFMKAWLKGEGLTPEHRQMHGVKYQVQIQLYAFVAHAAMASVLAVLFDVIGVSSYTLALSLGLLIAFGFVVTGRFIDMVYTTQGKHYEMRSQIKFLVSSGYYLTIIAVMSAVLFYLVSH